MNRSWKIGFNFGVTSGIITTLGLMIGLNTATSSKLAIIGGILTIAIADACSDALGIHIAREGENNHTEKQIWEATFSTFFFKFVFASVFIVPFLVFSLANAVIFNLIFGITLLTIFSYNLSKKNKWNVVFEHLMLACLVIALSYGVGKLVEILF